MNMQKVRFMKGQIDIITYDYTGYGVSYPSKSKEKEFYTDIEVVTSFAIEKLRFKLNQIIIWGFSLGSGPSINIASKFMFGGLLLQSPIVSIHSWVYNIFDFTKLTKIRENDLFENYLKMSYH